MFERIETPLQPRTLDALWLSAREAWNVVSSFFAPSFEAFAAGRVKREEHVRTREMVLGMEHFLRRALLLAAMALEALALPGFGPRKAGPRSTQAKRPRSLPIFDPLPPKTRAASPRRVRTPAPGPTPWGRQVDRYHRERGQQFKRRNLARDPLEPRPPCPAALRSAPPPQAEPGQRLPLRSPTVPGRGLALRMIALHRVLEAPEAHALRLRRRLDRRRADAPITPGRAPLRIAPWPRDRYARRIFGHDTLYWLWPDAEHEIRAMLDTT